jgi:hypothetical protein
MTRTHQKTSSSRTGASRHFRYPDSTAVLSVFKPLTKTARRRRGRRWDVPGVSEMRVRSSSKQFARHPGQIKMIIVRHRVN